MSSRPTTGSSTRSSTGTEEPALADGRSLPRPGGRITRLALVAVLGLAIGGVAYLALGVLGAPGPRAAPGWQLLAEMPSPRGETAGASTGARLIVLGGLSGLDSAASDQVSIYDASTGSWSVGPRLPEPRHHAAAAIVDGNVYFGGGAAADGAARSEVWILPAEGSTWRQVAPMPDPRFGLRLVEVSGRLYAIGGRPNAPIDGESGVDLLIYDIAADTWSKGAPLPLNRDHLAVVVVRDQIWAIGGRADGVNHARVDIYDPATGSWRDGPSLPEATSGAAEAVIDGVIYISGGEDPSARVIVDRHWQLDTGAISELQSSPWLPLPLPPFAVHGASGANLDNHFVMVGGSTRPGAQSSTSWMGATQKLLP